MRGSCLTIVNLLLIATFRQLTVTTYQTIVSKHWAGLLLALWLLAIGAFRILQMVDFDPQLLDSDGHYSLSGSFGYWLDALLYDRRRKGTGILVPLSLLALTSWPFTWYKTAISGEKDTYWDKKHEGNYHSAWCKLLFVSVLPLLSSMAVLYHVND